LAKGLSFFGISSIFIKASAFFIAYIAMKELKPELYGAWTLLSPILIYSFLFAFGTPSAMSRQIPIIKGRGENEKIPEIYGVTFFVMFCSAIAACVIAVIGLEYLWKYQDLYKIMASVVLLIFSYNFNLYVQSYCRSNDRFDLLSKGGVLQAVIYLLFSATGIFYAGLVGFIVGQSAAFFVSALFVVWLGNIKLFFRRNSKVFLQLAKDGLPFALISLSSVLFEVVDRLIIWLMISVESVGFYGLSMIVHSIIVMVPTLLSQFFYPKMAREYGRDSFVSVRAFHAKNVRANLVSSAAIPVSVLLTGMWLVPIFLPDYVSGLPAMYINILAASIFSIGLPWGTLLLMYGSHKIRLKIIFVSLLINAILGVSAVLFGLGIEGVAVATLASSIIMTIWLFIVARKYLSKSELLNEVIN